MSCKEGEREDLRLADCLDLRDGHAYPDTEAQDIDLWPQWLSAPGPNRYVASRSDRQQGQLPQAEFLRSQQCPANPDTWLLAPAHFATDRRSGKTSNQSGPIECNSALVPRRWWSDRKRRLPQQRSGSHRRAISGDTTVAQKHAA